ncbi:MAG: hypothetical protein IJD46_02720 [Bacilli bacterium]|nr:hypothetical protein [Bacilli bacterium]
MNNYKDDELLQDEEELTQEIKKYDKGFLNKVPYSIKAILIKYWFYGAVCFFSLMGFIGISGENAALVGGLIAGALFDIACYNILEMIDHDNNKAKYYMMYKSKKIYSVFINVVYQVAVFLIAMVIISSIVSTYKDPVNNWFLQEPLSIALVLTAIDAIFLLIKNLLVKLFKK